MKNIWIRFGCFLIGYNYDILRNSSEASAKSVKRYTAALLIISILWGFIGYVFTNRYMHGGSLASLIGSIIFIIIIIQIERQIILTHNPNKYLKISRGILAVVMAILGSIIIDQIIFKDDIELQKISIIDKKVDKVLPTKTKELHSQIIALDSIIDKKENERLTLIADINKNPTIETYSNKTILETEITTTTDTTGKSTTTKKATPKIKTETSNVNNPNISLIEPLQKNIENLREDKRKKEEKLLHIEPTIKKEISSKVGFLDELNIMFDILTGSFIALFVWSLWFFLLFGIEMLILISKSFEKENDYEKIVIHHMDMQIKKLDLFNKMTIH